MNQRKGAATHLAKYTETDAVTQRVNLRRPVFNAVITAVDRPAPRPLQRRPAQCRSCASHPRARMLKFSGLWARFTSEVKPEHGVWN